MTLVLSFGSSDFVVQVSDRRLTAYQPNKITYVDDVNKSVLYGDRISFAYTGLASICGQPTERFLMEKLLKPSGVDFVDLAEYLATQATEAFSRMNLPPRFNSPGK